MLKWTGSKRLFYILLALIFFIGLMGSTLVKRDQLTWPEKFVNDTIGWAQSIFIQPARYVANFIEDISMMANLYEENKILKMTLAQYAIDTMRLNHLEAQNKRLKEALEYTERQKQYNNYRYRIAEVVAISPDTYNSTVKINLGSKDGIRNDMAVITVEGLVGRVVSVSPFFSNVQLITDMDSRSNNSKAISVTVKGKEDVSFGIIESYDKAKSLFVMSRIAQDDPLQVGDVVVTSGLGQVFPAGIPIGTVVSREVGEFGITHSALVKPAASFDHLREVFVIEDPGLR